MSADESIDRPAIGILEIASIARGVVVADAALKRARAMVFASRPVSTGKHLVLMRGTVADVQESMMAAREAAGDRLIDHLELAWLSDAIWPLIEGAALGPGEYFDWATDPNAEAIAIVETKTVCSAIAAGDAALKATDVVIRDVRLAVGIGGHAFFTLSGPLHAIEGAIESAHAVAEPHVINIEIIAQPADELRGRLIF